MEPPASPDPTRTLAELAGGDASAAERLMPLVYDELRALARRFFRSQPAGHTLQPTALVHEAFIHLAGQDDAAWRNQQHFKAVASIAMRQLLIQHARRRGAQKRGASWRQITLDERVAVAPAQTIDVLELDDALRELARLHERQARVVELRFLGGLTVEEVADVLGLSKRTIETDWRMARAWLRRTLLEGRAR